MKCPEDSQCLTCVGTTCTCGDCQDANKPCTEQKLRFKYKDENKKIQQ